MALWEMFDYGQNALKTYLSLQMLWLHRLRDFDHGEEMCGSAAESKQAPPPLLSCFLCELQRCRPKVECPELDNSCNLVLQDPRFEVKERLWCRD